jgi:hypothetical protein
MFGKLMNALRGMLRAVALAALVLTVFSLVEATIHACSGYSYWYSPSNCSPPPECTPLPGASGCLKTTKTTAYTGTRCKKHPIENKCICE